jgi:hypothetical protein
MHSGAAAEKLRTFACLGSTVVLPQICFPKKMAPG